MRRIEIDQSGKIEQSSFSTVVADSLGNYLHLTASDKRIIEDLYKRKGKKKMFKIETFAVLVALIILKTIKPHHIYVIDWEYPGHDDTIRSFIFRIMKRKGKVLLTHQITFGHVGKKSLSHIHAYQAFRSNSKEGKVLLADVLKMQKN